MKKETKAKGRFRLGVDSGGTFTDFCLMDESTGRVRVTKVASTPADPALAVLAGLEKLISGESVGARQIRFFLHGTTVATNALLEGKGGPVALITTEGFEDVLIIGRQQRPRLYDFRARRPRPLVPRRRCFGVPERVLYTGEVFKPLDEANTLSAFKKSRLRG